MLGERRRILTPERFLLVYFFIVSVNIFDYVIVAIVDVLLDIIL
jgi:hypothetical protein